MNIKGLSNAVNAYKINNYDKSEKSSKTVSHNARNTDTVEFSTQRPESVKEFKAIISNAINTSASEAKINELKNAVQTGNYNISSELIAKSIIG